MTNRILDRARKEIEQGNLWRAKEILQGAIRRESYDSQLFEMMGTVFLTMGDVPEAGRFLFLSGVRQPEYREAIELFLSRHRRKEPQEFSHLLPRKARLRTLSEYPQEVAQVFREMGFPEVLTDEVGRVYQPSPTGKDIAGWVIFGTIAVAALALIILGVVKLLELIR